MNKIMAMAVPARNAFSLAGKRVFIAGHRGMVGSALVRRLQREQCEILTVGRDEIDLRRQADVENWLQSRRPDAVIVAAATVGGIHANNTRPADFLYDNLAIEQNLIHGAYLAGVKKLLFLGSSCIYPRLAPQPMAEDALLTGPLEPTNEWYAIAKIAGIKLCQAYRRQHGCDFISAMPTTLYGPDDNFNLQDGHVAAALLAKLHRARNESLPSIELWGTGEPLREFMYVDDLADALIFLMQHYSDEPFINIGTGEEISIRDLALLIGRVVGYRGGLTFDISKPNGMPRKSMKSDRLLSLGWHPRISLEEGFGRTYEWYVENLDRARC